MPPQTFGKCFFSPINLCCYVLLMCKWRLPMYFRLTTLKLPPQMSFHQHFFAIFFALGSTHDSTDYWNAHRSPATRESFKCVQCWVASAGWHRPGGIDRVASTGWHRPGAPPQQKSWLRRWGEAGLGLLVTPKYSYFRNLFPLVPVVGLYLHFPSLSAFLRSLFTQSSHLNCGLPRFLEPSCFFVSDLFGNSSYFTLTMCPAHFIRLLTILPTIGLQALVPINFFSQVFHYPSLHSP